MPTRLQISAKLRSRTDILITVFNPSKLHLLSKNLEQAFFYVIFFTHPFNEMFIVNGKSHRCNDTFTDIRFTLLLAKKFKKNTIIFMLIESSFD